MTAVALLVIAIGVPVWLYARHRHAEQQAAPLPRPVEPFDAWGGFDLARLHHPVLSEISDKSAGDVRPSRRATQRRRVP